jgi:hypothetical protein
MANPANPAKPEPDTKPADAAEDPRDKKLAALEAENERLRSDLEGARRALADLGEQIKIRPIAPGAKLGKPVFFAKTRILHNGATIVAGAPLPFDPTDAEAAAKGGFTGFEPGVHYELR